MSKLSLNRETLRNLSLSETNSVNGGTDDAITRLPWTQGATNCNCNIQFFNTTIFINPNPIDLIGGGMVIVGR